MLTPISLALLLAACGSNGETAQAPASETEPATNAATAPEMPKGKGASEAAASAAADEQAATGTLDKDAADGKADAGEEDDSVTANGIRSVYTDIPPATACRKIREDIEASAGTLRCAGYGGVPIFIKDGDARTDIDAGVEGDFYTLPAFNSAKGKIEWRLGPDGKPFAFIYRLTTPQMGDIASTSALIVETVGASGKAGCTIAEVKGSATNANIVAREKADAVRGGKVTCLRY